MMENPQKEANKGFNNTPACNKYKYIMREAGFLLSIYYKRKERQAKWDWTY